MCRHLWLVIGVFLCGPCACFREIGSVQQGSRASPALVLEVRDGHDALWDAESAPRMPVFFLQAEDAAPLDLERHLFLLRGAPTTALIEDLGSATLRAATEMAREPLRTEPCPHAAGALCASPRTPLRAGARYTLVWAGEASTTTFPIAVSRSPAAGAQLVESLPGDLSNGVPTNLTRLHLRFDGYVRGDSDAFTLRDARGNGLALRSQLRPCAELGLPPGDCVELMPASELAPAARHTLQLSGQLYDLTATPLSIPELSFTTGSEPDRRAPQLRMLDCAKDERSVATLCVLADEHGVALRARSDECGLLSLVGEHAQAAALGATGDYALALPLSTESTFTLALSDLAGNTTYAPITLAPALDLAPVSIDEVRVDPLGLEPAQEYVELLNFGANSLSIMGFSLTTDALAQGQVIAGEHLLLPGERVLLVAPDFDPRDASDGVLPAGVRLVRLGRPLSLRNEGTPLYLRDAQGRRLSAAPSLPPEKPGQCIHRIGDDPRSGDALQFARDAHAACTPGSASAP